MPGHAPLPGLPQVKTPHPHARGDHNPQMHPVLCATSAWRDRPMNLSLLPVRPGQFSSRLGPQSCHRFEYKLLCLHLCHDCFRMVRQRARGLSTTPLHDACAPTRSSQLSSYRCWQGCRVDSAVTLCRRRGIRLVLALPLAFSLLVACTLRLPTVRAL